MERSSAAQDGAPAADVDIASAGGRLALAGAGAGALLGGLWGGLVILVGSPDVPSLAVFGVLVGTLVGAVLGLIAEGLTLALLLVQQRTFRRTTRTRLRVTATTVPTVGALAVFVLFVASPPGSVLQRTVAVVVMTSLAAALAWAASTCSLRLRR